MTLLDRLRWAVAPDQRRSTSIMLGGIGVFMALGGLAVLVDVPRAIAGLMGLIMLGAWLVAGCGVVGYVRWFFRGEVDKLKQR